VENKEQDVSGHSRRDVKTMEHIGMEEYEVTVSSVYRKVYYVEAESWEEAQDLATDGREPNSEEFLQDQIDVECT
tara:strand:- start:209 stop:433 length:225 start_codon:yes stop_codon:yes gene_type:complete